MQKEFVLIVKDSTVQCKNYFGDSLIATYLHGSVAFGDAIPYVSDLDYYIVISRELVEQDKLQLQQIEVELQQKYSVINGVHLTVHSVHELKDDAFARFVLKYNSLRYYGIDIITEIESDCNKILVPDARVAKGRISFARICFEDALNGKQPMCTGELPANTYYIARKFARYFVIIEGAYFLMSQGNFSLFAKEDVSCGLYKSTQNFKNELDMASAVLNNPINAKITHKELLKGIRPLVEWMFKVIENV